MQGSKHRSALGRGLDALIPSGPGETLGGGISEVDIDRISPNRYQPRETFDSDALSDLAQSIVENGIIQPLVLRPNGADFQIVAGERRWRAAQLAGLKRVPAVVKHVADSKLLEVALVENVQRQDLSALETARALQLLMDDHGLTQEEVAERVGLKRPTVANYVRLLTLAEPVREALARGVLEMGHARAIGGLEDQSAQAEACKTAIKGRLSVRQVEQLVQRTKGGAAGASAKQQRRDPDVIAAEKRLHRALGARVNIVRNSRGAGKIEIFFRSDEELESLFSILVDDRSPAAVTD